MTLGARLAAAREARGVSLEDVARRTRIPLGGLRSLEADAYERLPPPIFARGYVRAYATEIGLDPETLIAQFDAERPVPEPPPDVRAGTVSAEYEPPPGRIRRSRRLASVGVAAAVIAWVTWSGREPLSVTGAIPQPQTAAALAAPEPVGTTGETSAVAVEADGVSVVLNAERECWVTAMSDGERAIYRLMRAGEREAVRARERVWLRIGDAGAVTLSVNGGAPQLAGADGAVRTLILTAGGPPPPLAAGALPAPQGN